MALPNYEINEYVRCAQLLGAVYATAGQLLFLACPSKSNQKEGHPAYRPLRGFPALLAMPGGCGTRAIRCAATRSDKSSPNSPAWLRYSAVHRGPEGQQQWRVHAIKMHLEFFGA